MYIRIHFYLFVFMSYLFYRGKICEYLLFYLSAFTHEVAHIVVSLLLGVDIKELYLNPFGVNARFEKTNSVWKEICISLAGPFMSLLLYVFSKDIFVRYINLAILFTNLLPIYPLDGGRVLRAILIRFYGYSNSLKVYRLVGIIMILLIFTMAMVLSVLYHNFYLLFFVLYVFWLYKDEIKKERILGIINYLQKAE